MIDVFCFSSGQKQARRTNWYFGRVFCYAKVSNTRLGQPVLGNPHKNAPDRRHVQFFVKLPCHHNKLTSTKMLRSYVFPQAVPSLMNYLYAYSIKSSFLVQMHVRIKNKGVD